jgi:hypothetical protein
MSRAPTEPPGRTMPRPVRPTYRLNAGRYGPSITCLRCGAESHNENDVRNLYCGFCHEFHGER